MSVLTERLDALRTLVQSNGFLTGDGLSNEVNIRIFCYAAADEMPVQHFIRQLVTDQSLNCHLIECNLYQVFLSICEDMGIQDEIPVMEEAIIKASKAVNEIIKNGPQSAMNKYNSR